jgi:MFS family permease
MNCDLIIHESSPSERNVGGGIVHRLPFYYGWVNVVVAAFAMLATLPARTQGLGLITEPLLRELRLDRVAYAEINLWATIIGSLCCLPVGRWMDRVGARAVLAAMIAGLGLTVWGMSAATGVVAFALVVTLSRGLGQSGLSVVSIGLVGKWFRRRISLAMGVYAVLVGVLFAVGFGVVGYLIREHGWRMAWRDIAFALLFAYLPIAWLLTRSDPRSAGVQADEDGGKLEESPTGMTLSAALATPAFWVFALATSVFGLAVSGIGLFNEAILRELGFDTKTYHMILAGTALVGLLSQLASGWIGWKWSLRRLMVIALGLYAISLIWLPHVGSLTTLWSNAILMGAAGGMITVVFFAIWPAFFGRAHLGRIQGAAQMLTVLSSAIGPILFAKCQLRTGSFAPALYALAPLVLVLAIATYFVAAPSNSTSATRLAKHD